MEQELPICLVAQEKPLDWSSAVWNSLDWRQSRLKALRSLLSENPYRSLYLVDDLGRHWSDLDMDLVNRDLGWGPATKLLATVIFNEKEILLHNRLYPDLPLKPCYQVGCKVIREGMCWQDKVGKGPQEGDFVIHITEEGILDEVSFRRTPPIAEEWVDGKLMTMEVSCIEGVDSLELLNPRNGADRNREVAGTGDLTLALLLQQGRRVVAPQRAP